MMSTEADFGGGASSRKELNQTESVAGDPMAPGDQAPQGTPGTGENVCPRCGGTGKLAGGDCPECQGSGKVTGGIGGA